MNNVSAARKKLSSQIVFLNNAFSKILVSLFSHKSHFSIKDILFG